MDILTGTLGKAFGGAVGGFTTGRREIIDMLRQRSRPYLFSNSLPPAVVGAGIELFKMLGREQRTARPAGGQRGAFPRGHDGRRLRHQTHAVGHLRRDALRRQAVAGFRRAVCRTEGVFVTGFYYPVVPKGQARIRVQVSAGHTVEQLDRCIAAFVKVGKELNVIK